MIRRIITLSSALSLALLAACGGSGGGATSSFVPKPSSSASSAPNVSGPNTVSFVIDVPAASTSSSAKRPAYVSSNTGSVAISLESVNGATPTTSSAPTVAAVGASASGCEPAASGYTCTVVVAAPTGDDLFSIATYQSANGSGTPLATTAVAASVSTSPASVTLSLGGVPASVSFSPARLPLVDDGNVHRVAVTLNVADASGATILGSSAYQSPVSLQIENDPASALSLSTTSVTQPGTVVTVTYNSAKPLSNASIVASDNGMKPATLVAAPLVVSPGLVTMFDDSPSSGVTLTEAGFTGSFTATVGNAADATVAVVPGTLGSGTAVVTITPKVHFDVTTLNVSDGNLTAQIPIQIVPQNSGYTAIGTQHTLQAPGNMVAGPGGILWTGDSGTGNLVSFNPSSGNYATFSVDTSGNGPRGIAFDANGNIWFGDGPQIGEFNPSTQVTQFYSSGLEPNAVVSSIIAGPSGTMWFYDAATYAAGVSGQPTYFGSINTSSGAITEYESASGAGPVSGTSGVGVVAGMLSMVLAQDGSIWFADQYNYSMGHINTSSGAITEYKISEPAYPQESPVQVAAAPNGKIWFLADGLSSGMSIAGSVDPSNGNAIAYYPSFPGLGLFTSSGIGSDGYMWFTYDPVSLGASSQADLGVLNPTTGAVYLYPPFLPQFTNVASIVDRGDGTLWMLDSAFGQIGKVTFK